MLWTGFLMDYIDCHVVESISLLLNKVGNRHLGDPNMTELRITCPLQNLQAFKQPKLFYWLWIKTTAVSVFFMLVCLFHTVYNQNYVKEHIATASKERILSQCALKNQLARNSAVSSISTKYKCAQILER